MTFTAGSRVLVAPRSLCPRLAAVTPLAGPGTVDALTPFVGTPTGALVTLDSGALVAVALNVLAAL